MKRFRRTTRARALLQGMVRPLVIGWVTLAALTLPFAPDPIPTSEMVSAAFAKDGGDDGDGGGHGDGGHGDGDDGDDGDDGASGHGDDAEGHGGDHDGGRGDSGLGGHGSSGQGGDGNAPRGHTGLSGLGGFQGLSPVSAQEEAGLVGNWGAGSRK